MVRVSNEPLLPLRRFLQAPFGALGAALLQAPPMLTQFAAKCFDFLARVGLALTGDGDFYDSQIRYWNCAILNGVKATDYKHLNHSGIYLLRNNRDGKIYVGQAGNIFHRLYDHLKSKNFKLKSKLYRAAAKYGWDAFTCELLEKVDDPEMLNERETFWIQHFQAHVNGYNICEFGGVTRNYRHSEETKQKMSDNRSSYIGELNPFFGKKHSAESNAKIGAANAKWERTEEYKAKLKASKSPKSGWQAKKVEQLCPNTGVVLRIWENRFEAASSLGVHHASISKACRGTLQTAKGFRWRYVE